MLWVVFFIQNNSINLWSLEGAIALSEGAKLDVHATIKS